MPFCRARAAARRILACAGAALLCAAALAACGRVPAAASGPALPAGCGPEPGRAPAASSVPASAAAAGTPLPVWGPQVRAIAAGGGAMFASTFGAADGQRLFASTDGGAHWLPASTAPAPGGQALAPMAASPDGATLAGIAGGRLWLGQIGPGSASAASAAGASTVPSTAAASAAPAAAAPASSSPPALAWREAAPASLWDFAFDPAASARLAAVGGSTGPAGTATLWLSADGGRTWAAAALPGHPAGTAATASAVAFWDGRAVVALAEVGGVVGVYSAAPGGPASALPALPPAAGHQVESLAAAPGGTLDLLTANGLYGLSAPGAPWAAIALPAGAGAKPASILVYAGGAALVGIGSTAWVAPAPSGPWRAVALPGTASGAPIASGGGVWVPTAAGPVRVTPSGAAAASAAGMPAPVSVVTSAAWRPTTVVAGSSNELFASTDGGRSFTPVGAPPDEPGASIVSLQLSAGGGCLALVYLAEELAPGTPAAWLSGNLGRTWSPVVVPAAGGRSVTALAEWPPDSGVWWASPGGAEGALYRSEPGRAVWTRVEAAVGGGGGAVEVAGGGTGRPVAVGGGALAAGPGGLWVAEGTGAGLRLEEAGPRLLRWWRAAIGRLSAGRAEPGALAAVPGWGTGGAAVAADPYDAQAVYAGLRRSLDGGQTWSLLAEGPAQWNPMAAPRGYAFDPGSPAAAIAVWSSALRDDGGGWVTLWTPPQPDMFVSGIAGAGGDGFYLAVQGLGLVLVRDAAARSQAAAGAPAAVPGTWTTPGAAPHPAPAAAAPRAVAPSDPSTVYLVDWPGALRVSADGGQTFGPAEEVALPGGGACCTDGDVAGPQLDLSAVAVAPGASGTVFVGIAAQDAVPPGIQAGLWVSADGGRTWAQTGLPKDLNVDGVAALSGGGAAGTGTAGAAAAEGSGAAEEGAQGAGGGAAARGRGGAAAGAAGAEAESGAGKGQAAGAGTGAGAAGGAGAVAAAAVAGAGSTVLLVAAQPLAGAPEPALWRSTDGGATWRVVTAAGPVFAVAAGPGQEALAGGQDAVLVSSDGGLTWKRLPVGLAAWAQGISGTLGGASVSSVLRAPNGWLYAGSLSGGVALSRDGGLTWQDISMPVGDPDVEPGGLSAGPGGAIDVATAEGLFVFHPAAAS